MATIKKTFQVTGMSCAVCALNVETTLNAQAGVKEAKVNFANATVSVEYDTVVDYEIPARSRPASAVLVLAGLYANRIVAYVEG